MRRAVLITALALLCGAPPATALGRFQWVSVPAIGGGRSGTLRGRAFALLPARAVVVAGGYVSGVRPGMRVVLQQSREGSRWRTAAVATLHRGRVLARLRTGREGDHVRFRFAVVDRHGAQLASGAARTVELVPRPIPCLAPKLAPLPPGDGAIVGGVVTAGGPWPGVSICGTARGTVVTLTDDAGAPVASQVISGRQSYAFVVPPGSYQLSVSWRPLAQEEVHATSGRVSPEDYVIGIS